MKNNNTAFDVILSPVVTEKSTNLNALNKLTLASTFRAIMRT